MWGKLKNRNNLLMKLPGSTWGASANSQLSSALELCYLAAEYCAPVRSCSAHTSQVDVQLNSTMCLISGTLRSTPLPWLPVLSNIEPPAIRRKAATDKLVEKIVKHDSWPIQPDILNPSLLRLTSRKPLWQDFQPVDINSRWSHNWKSAQVVNSHLVCDPTIQQLGFDLPRQQWSLLNRFHREQGHCSAWRRKWRLTDTDLCPCGETQMMSHIVESCPLTKLNGGLSQLHSADEDDVLWLTMTSIREEEEEEEVKNHPIFMKFCTQQHILNWMNVTWSKMKKSHWTDSEFDRTYFLFILAVVVGRFSRCNGPCSRIYLGQFKKSNVPECYFWWNVSELFIIYYSGCTSGYLIQVALLLQRGHAMLCVHQ